MSAPTPCRGRFHKSGCVFYRDCSQSSRSGTVRKEIPRAANYTEAFCTGAAQKFFHAGFRKGFPILSLRAKAFLLAAPNCLNKAASRFSFARTLPAGYVVRKPAHFLLENPISKKPLSPLPCEPRIAGGRGHSHSSFKREHIAPRYLKMKSAPQTKGLPIIFAVRAVFPQRVPVACAREIGKRRLPRIAPPFFARGKRNGGRSDRCGNNRTIRKFGRIRLGANSRPPIPPDRKTHRHFQSPRHKNPYSYSKYFRLLHFRGRQKVAAVFESFSDATASSSTALREIGLKPPPDCHEGIPHARVAERKFDGKPVPAETIGTAAANLRAHIYAARGNLCDETVSVRIRNPKREFVFPPENCAFILPDISKRASGFSDSDDPFPEFTAPPLTATVSRLPR